MLEKLKLLLGITGGEKDALLVLLLEKAEGYTLNYCGIDARPAALDGVVLDLAVIYYNRMGIEGEQSRSEGSVSRSLFAGDIPPGLTAQLNRYRKARVIGV